MARIAPEKSRVELRHEAGRMRITIQVRRNLFIVPFLAAWLGGWAVGETVVVRHLLSSPSPHEPFLARAFMMFWLSAWSVGGVAVIGVLALCLVGREVITLDARTLAVRLAAGPFGHTREFDLAEVRNMRYEARTPAAAGAQARAGKRFSTVTFDYGARSYRFGGALDGSDVDVVLDALRERLPVQPRA
jgi:hypothetical protein